MLSELSSETLSTSEDCLARAQVLVEAAAHCHPEDAMFLLPRIQQKLSTGMPIPAFLDDIAAEAESWAAIGRDIELETYGRAIIRQLGTVVIGSNNPAALKRLQVTVWDHLPQADRMRFLARLDEGGAFAGRVAA